MIKIRDFFKIRISVKIRILGNACLLSELDSFPVPKDFSHEVGGGVNKCYFSILCDEMCQCLEEFINH